MASASLVRRGGASGRFSATCVACDGVTVVAGAPTGSLRLLRARRQRQEGAVAGAPAWDLELVRIVAPVGDALSAREAPTAVALRDTEGLAALGGASGLVRFVSVAAQDAGAQRLRPLTALRGAALVALEFGAEGAALAAADASGRVVVFWRSGALEGDPEAPFAQVHTVALRPQPQAVVQLSFDATVGMGLEPESDSPSSPTPPLLVASTRHFAVVVDAARKAHSAVGTKPRDAPLGAVFHRQAARAAAPAGSDQAGCEAAAILAARPGRRLWIAAASGRVLGTLKLPALGAEGPQAFGSLHALGPLVLSVAGSGVAVVDPVAARTLCAFPIAAAAAAAAPELGLAYVLERAEGSSDARLWVLSAPCTAAEYAHAARAAGDIALAESAEARVAALAIASTPEEAPPPPSFELASTSGGGADGGASGADGGAAAARAASVDRSVAADGGVASDGSAQPNSESDGMAGPTSAAADAAPDLWQDGAPVAAAPEPAPMAAVPRIRGKKKKRKPRVASIDAAKSTPASRALPLAATVPSSDEGREHPARVAMGDEGCESACGIMPPPAPPPEQVAAENAAAAAEAARRASAEAAEAPAAPPSPLHAEASGAGGAEEEQDNAPGTPKAVDIAADVGHAPAADGSGCAPLAVKAEEVLAATAADEAAAAAAAEAAAAAAHREWSLSEEAFEEAAASALQTDAAGPLESLLGSPDDIASPTARERAARLVLLALAHGAVLPAVRAARLTVLAASACATVCGSVAAASALATDEAVVALEELEARGDGAEDACTAACREVLAHCL